MGGSPRELVLEGLEARSWKLKSEPGLGSRPWDPNLVLWMGVLAGGSLLAGVSLSLGLGTLSWIRAELLGQQQARGGRSLAPPLPLASSKQDLGSARTDDFL